MPGKYPKRVSRIFSQKAPLIPIVKKTPRGGRIIAKSILKKFINKISYVGFPRYKFLIVFVEKFLKNRIVLAVFSTFQFPLRIIIMI